MNKLPLEKRVQILSLMVEGASMRSISRVVDVSINTVTRYLELAGEACEAFHNETVQKVTSKRVQCDEIWSFTHCKDASLSKAKAAPEGAGDTWTWTALDADSKLIISWLVGGRGIEYAIAFMDDVASRLANRVQLSTDGHKAYFIAVDEVFAQDIDYAQIIKLYGPENRGPYKKYSPPACIGTRKRRMIGSPEKKHISTSYVERQNLTMRMSMRRFTRLTNAYSKKVANHRHALALYFVWYNFVRLHQSLRTTPAMAAGLTEKTFDMSDIAALIEAREPAPKKRGPYKIVLNSN